MNMGAFIGASLITAFIVAVGLPMAMGVFFRGFMKKISPNIPAFMAAVVMFGVQQVLVYRSDARMSTVLPRVQKIMPESIRYEPWTVICLGLILIIAGVFIPFVFARLGIRISDFVDQMMEKIRNFFGRIFHRGSA
jgi:hypothetical protein